ncbi:MAG: helix-hairpin-helix domain-containing protein [Candidatus Binatia bacterium]
MKKQLTANTVNFRIARRLEEVAQILASQGANPFRVQAYRHAAETLRHLTRPAEEILRQEGEPGLRKLPGIGERLARSIATLLITGRLPMLDRLRGKSESGALLASVPGIGKSLAARLHRELGIDTLEQLESAAHDGRLIAITGIGNKRVAGIIDSLSARLGRVRPIRPVHSAKEAAIAELLDVDREYREKATAGALPTIAPHRFNPSRETWLPILHSNRGERHYVAMFSNTARAHQMGKTRDWVILYYDGPDGERQSTVITSQRGALIGERIVRGRESECLEHYRQAAFHSVPADSTDQTVENPAPVAHQAAG